MFLTLDKLSARVPEITGWAVRAAQPVDDVLTCVALGPVAASALAPARPPTHPRGEVLAMASDDATGTIVAELDLALIRDQRLQEPIFRGFQPDLYRFGNL